MSSHHCSCNALRLFYILLHFTRRNRRKNLGRRNQNQKWKTWRRGRNWRSRISRSWKRCETSVKRVGFYCLGKNTRRLQPTAYCFLCRRSQHLWKHRTTTTTVPATPLPSPAAAPGWSVTPPQQRLRSITASLLSTGKRNVINTKTSAWLRSYDWHQLWSARTHAKVTSGATHSLHVFVVSIFLFFVHGYCLLLFVQRWCKCFLFFHADE